MKITITYRNKKSGISMRVLKSGDVSVSVPIGVSKERVMSFIEQNREWIDQARERMAANANRINDFFNRLPLQTRQDAANASAALAEIIQPIIDKYEPLMGVGARKYSFSRAKGRWGSCNARTGSIRFSIYLILLPHWCIEHVVVHELAHLIEPNHSPRFYAVMDRFFPRWREARTETKRMLKSM